MDRNVPRPTKGDQQLDIPTTALGIVRPACRSARRPSRSTTASTGRSRGRSRAASCSPATGSPPSAGCATSSGVSRATVRRAIEELVGDGLVEAPRPRLVRHRRRARRAAQHADEPLRAGPLARARGLARACSALELRPATIDEAEAFGIAPGAELLALERLRMLDGLPISLDHNRVPLRLAPGIADLDFTTRVAVRRARARRASARARGLRARGPRRGRARGRATGTGAGCAGPLRDNGRDRRGRPGPGPGPDRVPRRPLPLPGDADASCTEGEGDQQ